MSKLLSGSVYSTIWKIEIVHIWLQMETDSNSALSPDNKTNQVRSYGKSQTAGINYIAGLQK